MSAARHVNVEQLRMFMTPNEIVGSDILYGDQVSGETREEMFAYKRDDSERRWADPTEPGGAMLDESIRREGVKKPVAIGHTAYTEGRPVFTDGHHRLAMAYELAPDNYIPVTHWGDQGKLGPGRHAQTPLQARAERLFGGKEVATEGTWKGYKWPSEGGLSE